MTHIFENELSELYQQYLTYNETLDKTKRYYSKPSYENFCEILISDYTPCWLTNFEHIEQHSDNIGEGCYSVFKFKDNYYRIPYSYKSHCGSDYYGDGSDIRRVNPVVKEVRVWE